MAIISPIDCVLPRPDIGQLRDELAAELSIRLLGGAPVLPGSAEDVLAFVCGGAVNLMFGAVAQTLAQNDTATMCCDNLVRYGARRGIDLRGATRAKGYVAITGTPAASIPSTIRFVGASSREYKPDPATVTNPVELDAQGRAAIRVVAAGPGSIFNLDVGSPLTVTTTLPGIDMAATVVGSGLAGGSNDETCEALRSRVLAAEASETVVVTEAWLLQQTLQYPGVTRACTDDCAGCCDPTFTVVYPFMESVYGADYMTEPYGVPPCDVLDEMTAWMFGAEPGRGQGLAQIGQRGVYAAALPTVMNISAQCLSGCPDGAADRIKTALWPFIRSSTCVGSTICKDEMRGQIMRALGPGLCLAHIQLDFGDTIGNEDDANAYLACGRFLVLGSIDLQAGLT